MMFKKIIFHDNFFVVYIVLINFFSLTFQTTKVLYYKRFSGNYYHKYDGDYPNYDNCDGSQACYSSLRSYNEWTSSNPNYHMDSSIYYQCYIYKTFGGHTFGQTDLIKKTFVYVPIHTAVNITFDILKMDSWDNEYFYFDVDNVNYYSAFYDFSGNDWCGDAPTYFGNNVFNEKFYHINIALSHTSSSLTLAFHSNLDSLPYDESYGLQNLRVYLIKNCDPTCSACDSLTPNICTKCPFFAIVSTITNKCVCMDKFYMDTSDFTHCAECDITCKTCTGPTSSDCLSCYTYDILSNGYCYPPYNQFKYAVEFPGSGFDQTALSSWKAIKSVTGEQYLSTECGLYTMVGGYDNFGVGASVEKNFTSLPPHYAVAVLVDFYKIDSWDNEIFYLTIDSVMRFRQYSYPLDAIYCRNFCGSSWNDNFETIYEIFNHSSITANVNLRTSLDQYPNDESWGFNNFQFSIFLCDSSCLTCSYVGANYCLSCYDGFYLANDGSCKICDSKCKLCSGNSQNCSSCQTNYHLVLNSCVSDFCPSGTYKITSNNTCGICHISCHLCHGSTSSDCYACSNGLYLLNNQCLPCNNNCSTCEITSTSCTSCNIGVLYNGVCQINCPSGYYQRNDQTCQKCDIACLVCSSIECIQCDNGFILSNGKCIACDPDCSKCAGSSNLCTDCNTGKFLTNAMTCETNCPNGQWGNITDSKCYNCDVSCLTCVGGTKNDCLDSNVGYFNNNNISLQCDSKCMTCDKNETNCTSCYNSSYLYGNDCLNACPTSYYDSDVNNTCERCSNECINCTGPYYNQCKSCNKTQYLYQGECLSCNINCLTCTNTSTYCTSCSSSTYLLENKCVALCSIGYWADVSTQTCSQCNINCLSCEPFGTSNSCLSCYSGAFLQNKQCNSCPIGCDICISSTNCTKCSEFYYMLNNQCLSNCSIGYWRDVLTGTCQICNETCLDCVGPSNEECTSCIDGEVLIGGKCESCDQSCLTCKGLSDSDCLSCIDPYYLQSNICVNSCSIGYYLNSSIRVCLKCSSSCSSCTDIGTDKCSKCLDFQFLNFIDNLNKIGTCSDTCPSGLINDRTNYTCIKECSVGRYKDIILNECVDCSENCLACKGEAMNDCLSCKSNQYLLNNLCLLACPNGYTANLLNNTCDSCINNCEICINSNQCLQCSSNFYLSNDSHTCMDCSLQGTYIENFTCKNCSYGCSKCISDKNCTKCQYNFYLVNESCFERTHVMPQLNSEPKASFVYYLSFNDTWPMLFQSLTETKSSYSISIENASFKKYRYVMKPSKFSSNVWEILLNITVSIQELSNMILYLYPPNDLYYNLAVDHLTSPIQNYVYCENLQIYNFSESMCEKLTIITPSLSLENNQKVILSFSSEFDELFDLLDNITMIYLENIPKSNYNCTLMKTDSKVNYDIILEFNQSLLNKPLLIVNFDLPGVLLYHPTKRLIPMLVSLVMKEFYYVSTLSNSVLKLQQNLENITRFTLLPLALIYGILCYGSLSFIGLLAINSIKYLRYINVEYPPNALSVFNYQTNFSFVPDFLSLESEQIVDLPENFKKYGVNSYFLLNGLDEVVYCLIILFIGILLNILTRNLKGKGLIQGFLKDLKIIFYLNAFLILFFNYLMDITFFSLCNISWNSFKTSKTSLNLIISVIVLVALIMMFILVFRVLKSYSAINEFYIFDETSSYTEKTIEKKELDTKGISIIKDNKYKQFANNYSHTWKPNVNRKSWWNEKNLENSEDDYETKNSARKLKAVSFKEDVSSILFANNMMRSLYDWNHIKVLTTDFKGDRLTDKLFILIQLIRYFIVPLIIVLFVNNSYYTVCGLSGLNSVFLAYLLCASPFKSSWKFMEYFLLESCVLMATIAALFTVIGENNMDFDYESKLLKGWVIFYSDIIAIFLVILIYVKGILDFFWNKAKKICFKRKNRKIVPGK